MPAKVMASHATSAVPGDGDSRPIMRTTGCSSPQAAAATDQRGRGARPR